MKPKALVIRTAGTNCDKESAVSLAQAGAKVDLRHINQLKDKKALAGCQIICLPGGFSYGDDLGAGKILSLELSLWFKDEIDEFIRRGGAMIGICNGFQVMVKMGILPDCDFQQKITLTDNDSGRFEARWVYLKVASSSIWLKGLPERITLPVAHGEGKFYAEKEILDKIEDTGCVALQYVDPAGGPAGYPFNPNGSCQDIAGITDCSGRLLGLMPHPERFIFPHQEPEWGRGRRPAPRDSLTFGRKIFENAVKHFK